MSLMHVTAIMAHPDDAEIWCGGTLAVHSASGDQTTICVLSHETGSRRGKEALHGARHLGCGLRLLGLPDIGIRDTDDAVVKVRNFIAECQPHLILTHWFDDAHPDHEATAKIVVRAVLSSLQGRGRHELGDVPRVFCCDTYGSLGLRGPFVPNRLVDVDSTWNVKTEAISAHKSQYLQHYLPMIDAQCRRHGATVGVTHSEGFVFVPLFGRQDVGIPLGRDKSLPLPEPEPACLGTAR